MKRVWKLCIRDSEGFDLKQGYALAATEEEARVMVGSPSNLSVFAKHPQMVWPGHLGERFYWH